MIRERDHLNALDGVRAVAAYAVIATHVGFNTGRSLDDSPGAPFLARMDFGVTLFFLLSGFLLYRPFARALQRGQKLPATVPFWWRRALRILPAFWIVVVVTLGVLSQRPATRADWLSYLGLVQTYDGHDVDPNLTQMWTLAVEVGFYAVLPLLARFAYLASRRIGASAAQLTLIGAMVVGALVANLLTHAIGGDLSAGILWLPCYLDWFAFGMIMAIATTHLSNATRERWAGSLYGWAVAAGTCWAIGGLLWWLSTLPLAGPRNLAVLSVWDWTIKHYLYGAAAFFLLLPLMLGTAGIVGQALGSAVPRWFGEISYGVYLWHLPLLLAIQRWMGWKSFTGHFVELYVLTAVAATVVAALSWHLVERPLLRRFSRPSRITTQQSEQDGGQHQQLDADAVRQRMA